MNSEQVDLNHRLREVKKKKYEKNTTQKNLISKLLQQKKTLANNRQAFNILIEGIPSIYRSRIWPQLIHNTHGITMNYYKILLKKVSSIKNSRYLLNENQNIITNFSKIQRDIPRTFPQLKIFSTNGNQISHHLFNILSVWSIFREDIGYIQNMSLIAGFLLLQLKEFEAFQAFSSIITSSTLFQFLTVDKNGISRFYSKFQHKLRIFDQQTFMLLKQAQIQTNMYIFNWIVTLFTRSFQLDALGKIWDMLIVHKFSQEILLEICYQILQILKKHFIDKRVEQAGQIHKILIKRKVQEIDEDVMLMGIKQNLGYY